LTMHAGSGSSRAHFKSAHTICIRPCS
jgi:hypothetical protein